MIERHRINPRLAAWTFGYTPGTKSICLTCRQPIVFVVGPKRHYWRHA